ncbi:hypothetical protein K2X85_09915 [bacterium]|nr:hypothetical protein [bacterium]
MGCWTGVVSIYVMMAADLPIRVPSERLPNLVQVTSEVYCGGLPEGALAFRELREFGIKTIISVDGATPDVENAKTAGLRYVHLPHGYDGVPSQRGHELARGVRDLPKPIYIHCHLGKHRSPAAAALACVESGLLPADQSLRVLQVAGTGDNYRGLYRDVRLARPASTEVLNHADATFPARASVPPMAEMMVALEKTFDRLIEAEKGGWMVPADSAQSPAHHALLLAEHYSELGRLQESRDRSAPFGELLRASEKEAYRLEESLKQSRVSDAARLLQTIKQNCVTCHQHFRDNVSPVP